MSRPTRNDFYAELDKAREHLERACGMFAQLRPTPGVWVHYYQKLVRLTLSVSSLERNMKRMRR